MFNILKYNESIEKLATSMVIKIEPIALTMNKYINKKYNVVNQFDLSKSEWKYYKNLSGEYHETDIINYPNKLEITLLETRETVTLTKEVLVDYPITRTALMNRDEIYQSLVTKYPLAHLLILGLIEPTPMNKLLSCKNGTILSHNRLLIAANETSLFPSLQIAVTDFVRRWVLEDFSLIDELYMADILHHTRNYLILKIHNHRLTMVKTGEVCNFHMNEYFKSNLAISRQTSFLTLKQKFWLYKHLRYLITNTGTTDVLHKVNVNVLQPAGIVMKEYGVYIQEPSLDLEQTGVYSTPDMVISDEVMRENSKCQLTKIDRDALLKGGLISIGTYNDIYKPAFPHLSHNINQLSRRPSVNEPSKYLGFKYELDTNFKTNNLVEISIENWIDLAYKKNASHIITYKDSNTNLLYALSPKESVLLLVKYLLNLTGQNDLVFQDIILNNILDKDAANLEVNVPANLEVTTEYGEHKMYIPVWENGVSPDEVKGYMVKIMHWYKLYDLHAVNNHMRTYMFLKGVMLDRIRKPIRVSLSDHDTTIDEILVNSEIGLIVGPDYDYYRATKDLMLACTGINIDTVATKRDFITAYMDIVKRLTSYTVLILKDSVHRTESIPGSRIGVVKDINASNIIAGDSTCFESNDGIMRAEIDFTLDSLSQARRPITHIEKLNEEIAGGRIVFSEAEDTLMYGTTTTMSCLTCLDVEEKEEL